MYTAISQNNFFSNNYNKMWDNLVKKIYNLYSETVNIGKKKMKTTAINGKIAHFHELFFLCFIFITPLRL